MNRMLTRESLRGMWAGPPVPWTDDAMDLDEFETVTAAMIEVCRESGTPVQIGCTSTYTGGTVRRARFAQRLRADAIQVALKHTPALLR